MRKVATMRHAAILGTLVLGGFTVPTSAQQPGGTEQAGRRILFVLDASGSMNQKLASGETRLDAARTALLDMLAKLPVSASVALRVYGHTSPPEKKNCDDTDLVAGFAPASTQAQSLRPRLAGLKALGYTPISRTLEKAARDFDGLRKGQRTVILVSDGRETCKADPCAVAAALAKADADLVVHTIGFGVDDAARRQLQCVSRVARGSYFDAETRGQLSDRLAEVAKLPPRPAPVETQRPAPPPVAKSEPQPRPQPSPAVPPKVEAPVGELKIKGLDQALPTMLTNSSTNTEFIFTPHADTIAVPPGIYTLTLANGAWPSIEVRAGETTEIAPAFLRIARPVDVIQLIDPETQEVAAEYHTGSSPLTAMVPGRYRLRTLTGFEWAELIELKWGQTHLLKSAILRMRPAAIPAGGIVEAIIRRADGGHSATVVFDVNNTAVMLPAGRYRIEFPGRSDAAPIAVELGDDTIVEIGTAP